MNLTRNPVTSYTFDKKDTQIEDPTTVQQKLSKLQTEYETKGMQTTVEGILVVHDHGHPHVLLVSPC